MKKSSKCVFCEEKIIDESNLFVLKEELEDWDMKIQKNIIIKEGSTVCGECLIEFIDDTERVTRTSPQITYRYIGIE